MSEESNLEENSFEPVSEPGESSLENPEDKDIADHALEAAQLLENPPEGSFLIGLHTFAAWVKSKLANDK